jgi:hypothetical protein
MQQRARRSKFPAASLGPNSNAPEHILHSNIILCCGEDRPELIAALRSIPAFRRKPTASHAYRCYEFWKYEAALVVWSGIGTGCVEPLLWELLTPGIVKQIALVGTAGRWSMSRTVHGRAYLISKAHFAGTALDGWRVAKPVAPRWPKLASFTGATASIVSTDFFYGFSELLITAKYPGATPRMVKRYRQMRHRTDLIDMEVAQFYYFCHKFGRGNVRFVAVKGPANVLGESDEQIEHSRGVLVECLRLANRMLRP